MDAGSFNLQQWNSNDSNVSQEIRKLENSEALKLCDNVQAVEDDQKYTKSINGTLYANDHLNVLGVSWDNNADIIQVELSRNCNIRKRPP